jgi:putative phosphoesterase
MNSSIAIISDIHGNEPALKAVLADIDRRGITSIYCLGDLVGYYCFYNEIVDMIRARNIPTIMGNHDYALVHNNGVIERSKTCTRILHWQLQGITPDNLSFLSTLPAHINLNISGKEICCVHGGLNDETDEYLFNVNDDYLKQAGFTKDVLITGHTHLPSYQRFYSGKTWLNPGSVGQPRDGINKASYLVINSDLNPEFVRIAYDYNIVVNAMKAAGFDDYISDTLITGKKIGL